MAIAEAPATATEGSTDGQAPANGTSASGKTRSKRSLAGIYVNTPPILRQVLETEAKSKNVSVASLVRDKLAGVYNLTLPAAAPRTRYATPQEKEAARKASNANRQDLMKRLMGIHRVKQSALGKGEVLTDEQAEVIWKEQEQAKAAKAAEAAAAKAQEQAAEAAAA